MREMPRYVDRGLFAGCAFCKIGSNGPKQYNPKRFAAVIMRIREPKTTALIFASGKMVVTGAKSEDDSKLASRKYARIIQKLGFNAKFTDFKIQNIVGSCDIKFPIRLEGLASKHHNFSSYEPELFPGLIYRMIKPKIVLLIFVSGKIVLTGAKVREEIYQAFEMIYPVLQGQSNVWMVYILFTLLTCCRFPQGLKTLRRHHVSAARQVVRHFSSQRLVTYPNPRSLMRTQQQQHTHQKAVRGRRPRLGERAGVSGCCIICHFFSFSSIASAFRHGNYREDTLYGRTPHRLRMGSSTKCARRRQCAPVGCRPNSAARRRAAREEAEKGPRSGQGDCDCSQANLANPLTEQPLAGCAKHKAAHVEGATGFGA